MEQISPSPRRRRGCSSLCSRETAARGGWDWGWLGPLGRRGSGPCPCLAVPSRWGLCFEKRGGTRCQRSQGAVTRNGAATAIRGVMKCWGCGAAGLAGMPRKACRELAASSSGSAEEPRGKGAGLGPVGAPGCPGRGEGEGIRKGYQPQGQGKGASRRFCLSVPVWGTPGPARSPDGVPGPASQNPLAAKGEELSRALRNRGRKGVLQSRVAGGQRSASERSGGYREASAA